MLDLLRKMDMPVMKAEVSEAVASELRLSETQRPSRIHKGSCRGWALNELRRTGFVTKPRRGFWTLSESGRHQPFQENLQERQRLTREARREKTETKKASTGGIDIPEAEAPNRKSSSSGP